MNAQTESALQGEDADVGGGARACVLFHQPNFDTAAVVLPPNGGEMAETNTSGHAMLYFVCESEEEQVEFDLTGTAAPCRVSKGVVVLVPPGAQYVLKNHSRHARAKFIIVVPRS